MTIVIVGGGPAGLTAAASLARRTDVVVLEREREAGGIPRHSDHPGYGLRDLHRFVSGPAYARTLTARAIAAGARIRTGAMATGWSADGGLEVTSPEGRETMTADAVVLATGARERPRPARLVPGDRGAGVYTTGQLQNLVHLHHGSPGSRAVVVGAELVSWSAVITLREARCRTVAMTTVHDRSESYAAFSAVGRLGLRVPMVTGSRVVAVHGRPRVTAVELESLGSGVRRTVECDTVVFTGDWIPDNELARAAGLDLDPGSRGPVVDTALRTSRPDVFAVGNLVHPVDTADVAALGGRHVAGQVLAWLDGRRPAPQAVPLTAAFPFRWVSPGVLRAGDPPPVRNRLLLWSDEEVRHPVVVVHQDGRRLVRRRVPWPVSPGRVFRLPARALADVDTTRGPVTIGLG